jgi:flavin reductase (DIM6/NTAB) family NADH-FMN oxidoreductase RutF
VPIRPVRAKATGIEPSSIAGMPSFIPGDLTDSETYFLLTSLVVPRPIAWVGSRSAKGTHNIAPHSYFNIVSSAPPIVHFTSTGVKDTLTNVRATGEFTVSIVSRDLLEAMNTTAADFPSDISEFDHVNVTKSMGATVDVPYVAEAPAALECRVRSILSMGNGNMVFGDVTRIVVADHVHDGERVDIGTLDPVGRLSGSQYTMSEEILRLPRPTWAQLQDR